MVTSLSYKIYFLLLSGVMEKYLYIKDNHYSVQSISKKLVLSCKQQYKFKINSCKN
ncbi:hypothetical protein pb186bvf_016485 [Paramecium bursaria]